VTVVLISIIAVLAIPTGNTIQNERAANSVKELTASLSLARSEAITREDRVTVCKRAADTDPTVNQCDNNGSNSWANGWIVFVDNAPGATPSVGAGDTIVRVSAALNSRLTLASETGDNNFVNFVSYSNEGFSTDYSNTVQDGILFLCDKKAGYTGTIARRIGVNTTGLISVQKSRSITSTEIANVPAVCNPT